MRDSGKFSWVADDPDCPDIMRLAALTEELGEVARALHDGNNGALDVELSHLAGVALAWNAAIHA